LAADQLTRLYDAVPLKAKALETIGNRLMLGNYTENYDIVGADGGNIKIDYLVSLVSSAIVPGTPTESNKSNRDYEIGIVYLDDFGRQTTVLTSPNNTVFIPNSASVSENRFRVSINHEAPSWATRYRFFIKQSRTDYDTIVPSLFYQDGVYVWVKVEANETDKFDVGDFIYVKTDSSQILAEAVQTRVLEIVDQPVNFLEQTAPDPFEELQQAGRYFKIKPDGFRLNEDDFILYEAVSLGFRSQITSNNFVNDTTYYVEDPVYYGSIGLNDLSVSGTYNGTTDIRYIVDINAVGATDSFRWSNDDGASWSADILITGAPQTIENGISVTFGFTTGHQLDDQWILSAKSGDVTASWRENSDGSAAGTVARSAIIHYAGKPSTGPGGETIKGGANITIIYDDTSSDGANPGISFTQNFVATQEYANIEEWFYGDNIINSIEYPTKFENLLFRRGFPSKPNADGFEQWTIDPNGDQIALCVASNEKYSGTERIYVNKFNTPSIQIRELTNNIVFETVPEVDNTEIYYEIGDTYTISSGLHQGKAGDTNQTGGSPAIINLNTFNCFSWGNGFESYKIKDLFNARSMKNDTRPSGTIEAYGENVRIADITWSKVYEQSSNFNGLNEFNLSTANFKQMDDKYQSIQHMFSDDTNLLVLQEDKVHNVPYQKDILFGADGSEVVRESNNVLGTERAYAGEYGISTNPESFAYFGNRKYWVDSRRGVVLRLSLDGITEISKYGMSDYFQDSFRNLPYSKKLGAYDLHDHQYVIHVSDTDGSPTTIVPCGAFINFYQLEAPVIYTLNLNTSDQPVVVNYDAGAGTVNINAFDGTSNFSSGNVTGSGNFQFSKTSSTITSVQITVTPVSTLPSVSIDVPCPVNLIVANNDSTSVFQGQSVTLDVLANDIFSSQVTVTIDSQGATGTAVVNPDKTITYTHGGANALPDSFVYQINDGNSTDTGTVSVTVNQLVAVNDSMQVFEEGSSSINVLANDTFDPSNVPTVTITSQGSFGVATVNPNKSITYNHTAGQVDDSFVYQISDGGSSDTATVTVDVIPDTGGGGGSQGQPFSMSGIGYDSGFTSNGEGACAFALTQTKYHDGVNVDPTLADTIYNDINKTTTFNGQNLYWTIPNGRTIRITQAGVVTDLWICGAGNA
jgi:hypothetical protein